MALIAQDALVLVGDGTRALFLRNSGTASDVRLVVEKVFEHDDPATHAQSRGRPIHGAISFGGGAAMVGSLRGDIGQSDWYQLNEHRFAKTISAKLYELAHVDSFQQLVLVAPPRVLQVLRQSLHRRILKRVMVELPADLTHAPIPAIRDALSS